MAAPQPATVNVNVAPVNDNPVANADAKSTNEDTPLIFAASHLVANDTDVDGDTLTVDLRSTRLPARMARSA